MARAEPSRSKWRAGTRSSVPGVKVVQPEVGVKEGGVDVGPQVVGPGLKLRLAGGLSVLVGEPGPQLQQAQVPDVGGQGLGHGDLGRNLRGPVGVALLAPV